MGFINRFYTNIRAEAAIGAAISAWKKAQQADPLLEPYEFMARAWKNEMLTAGQDLKGARSYELVVRYGVLPQPLCIRMMVAELCFHLMPDFAGTRVHAEWEHTMAKTNYAIVTKQVDMLNRQFEAQNPLSYGRFSDVFGRKPFEPS